MTIKSVHIQDFTHLKRTERERGLWLELNPITELNSIHTSDIWREEVHKRKVSKHKLKSNWKLKKLLLQLAISLALNLVIFMWLIDESCNELILKRINKERH